MTCGLGIWLKLTKEWCLWTGTGIGGANEGANFKLEVSCSWSEWSGWFAWLGYEGKNEKQV